MSLRTRNPSKKKIIDSILSIKKKISEKIRDRIYIKDFSKQIVELIYEIDDYEKNIDVEILEKTDLHKCFKSILSQNDVYSDMKEACYNLLEKISLNILDELFNKSNNNDVLLNLDNCNIFDNKYENDKVKLINELQILINQRNNEIEDDDNCFVRTDEKYLEIIKKNEINMMLEAKRRQKMKKNELEKYFLKNENTNPEEFFNNNFNFNFSHNDNLLFNENINSSKINIDCNKKVDRKANNRISKNKGKKSDHKVEIIKKGKFSFCIIIYKDQINFDVDSLFKTNLDKFKQKYNNKENKKKIFTKGKIKNKKLVN